MAGIGGLSLSTSESLNAVHRPTVIDGMSEISQQHLIPDLRLRNGSVDELLIGTGNTIL